MNLKNDFCLYFETEGVVELWAGCSFIKNWNPFCKCAVWFPI